MTKYYIGDLYEALRPADSCLSFDRTLTKISQQVVKKIDPTFPCQEFRAWVDSDTDEPFKWNHNKYYWECQCVKT